MENERRKIFQIEFRRPPYWTWELVKDDDRKTLSFDTRLKAETVLEELKRENRRKARFGKAYHTQYQIIETIEITIADLY